MRPTRRSIREAAAPGRAATTPRGRAQDGIIKPPYKMAEPLSDPVGGTDAQRPSPPACCSQSRRRCPAWTVGCPSSRSKATPPTAYGHPGLLGVAASILGDDFVPYNEVTFVKSRASGRRSPAPGPHDALSAARLGPGRARLQLHDPALSQHGGQRRLGAAGSLKRGRADIKKMVAAAARTASPGAVPMLCEAGDTIVTDRRLVHGSFANSSPDRRITLNAGFSAEARAGRDATAAARRRRDPRPPA